MVPSRWSSRHFAPSPANTSARQRFPYDPVLFRQWTGQRPSLLAVNIGGWRAVLSVEPLLMRRRRRQAALPHGGSP